MNVVKLIKHPKYDRLDVVEHYNPAWCEQYMPAWIANPPSADWGMVLPDDSPITLGWKYRNNTWEEPDNVSVEDVKVDQIEVIKTKRWEEEVAGVIVDDIPYDSSRESCASLNRARVRAIEDPNYSLYWKSKDNRWVSMYADTIQKVFDAVDKHVQDAFQKEMDLTMRIKASKTIADVQSFEWY